jgi:predicted AAA+ superfamily ATPase
MHQFKERFFKPPSGSYFIFGPRGTGKSTWLKKNYSDAKYIDLLDDITYRDHIAHPCFECRIKNKFRA